jgi:mRNA interferase RelE/StbE
MGENYLHKTVMSRLDPFYPLYTYPQLRNDPHYGPNIKRLKNWEPPTWRYRVGAWRFFYEINEREKIVYMITADHRSEAYR